MSEFTNSRLKKNAQIAEALSNLNKKDLYSWRNFGNNYRSNGRLAHSSSNNNLKQLVSPSFPTGPPLKLKSLDSNSNLTRVDSLKDLQKDYQRTKIVTSEINDNIRLKKLDRNQEDLKSNKRTEFLNSFNKNQVDDKNFALNVDRPYLNSARNDYIKKFRDRDSNTESIINDLMKKDSMHITEIDLSQLGLESIINVEKFKFLKILDLSCNKIKNLEYLNFKNLNELRLFANQIEKIGNLDQLKELQSLELQSNRIKKLDNCLSQLKKLEFLRLDQNNLDSIKSSELSSCSNLIYLNVSFNSLETISVILN